MGKLHDVLDSHAFYQEQASNVSELEKEIKNLLLEVINPTAFESFDNYIELMTRISEL